MKGFITLTASIAVVISSFVAFSGSAAAARNAECRAVRLRRRLAGRTCLPGSAECGDRPHHRPARHTCKAGAGGQQDARHQSVRRRTRDTLYGHARGVRPAGSLRARCHPDRLRWLTRYQLTGKVETLDVNETSSQARAGSTMFRQRARCNFRIRCPAAPIRGQAERSPGDSGSDTAPRDHRRRRRAGRASA